MMRNVYVFVVFLAHVFPASEGEHFEWWDLLSTGDSCSVGVLRRPGQVRRLQRGITWRRIPCEWSTPSTKVLLV